MYTQSLRKENVNTRRKGQKIKQIPVDNCKQNLRGIKELGGSRRKNFQFITLNIYHINNIHEMS